MPSESPTVASEFKCAALDEVILNLGLPASFLAKTKLLLRLVSLVSLKAAL
ncbi:MAG: hypothetical protein GDYSWBUE_001662 [Candidatus Fervidibacterota bacterium]